ncbi:MAG TPA: DNA-directed RNA polymerase subunit omega [Sulfurovum sp.]|nr:DNA-directed RNA polymerase subunit omega [Sulfurovum sp.]
MRLEKIIAVALENVNYDRYLLAKAVGKRADQLSRGAAPLVDMDVKKCMATDIAIHEIAEGKILVSLDV